MEATADYSRRANHAVVETNGKDKPAKQVLKTFESYHDAANYLTSLGQACVPINQVAPLEIWSTDGQDFSKPRYAYT